MEFERYDRLVLKILIPAFSSPLLLETQLKAVKAYLPTAEIWVVIDAKPGILSANRRRMIMSARKHTPYVVEFQRNSTFTEKVFILTRSVS